MKVKFKQLNPLAKLPAYSKLGDAGMDLTAVDYSETAYYSQFHTGLAVEIPEGYVGLIFPRSSISNMDYMLKNAVAVIDSGYRGEITLRFQRVAPGMHKTAKEYEVGDRIGQLIIMPYPKIETEWAEQLTETERGVGGYGSTGLN